MLFNIIDDISSKFIYINLRISGIRVHDKILFYFKQRHKWQVQRSFNNFNKRDMQVLYIPHIQRKSLPRIPEQHKTTSDGEENPYQSIEEVHKEKNNCETTSVSSPGNNHVVCLPEIKRSIRRSIRTPSMIYHTPKVRHSVELNYEDTPDVVKGLIHDDLTDSNSRLSKYIYNSPTTQNISVHRNSTLYDVCIYLN